MKKSFVKATVSLLTTFASLMVVTTASLFLIHNPKVPEELLK